MDISVIELFSGIGAQYQALLNSKHTVKRIATSEIDKDAMLSYAVMHCELTKEKLHNYTFPTKEEMIEFLLEKNIGFNFEKNISYNWTRLNIEKIQKYYLAAILSKNLGDISKIQDLPLADLWTYSFPCQSISVAGKKEGIIKGKTRSGLLYEVERLLENTKNKPKYLLLENVKNLIGKNFKPQFDEWIKKLDQLGYNTIYQVLNGREFNIPQNRERIFAVSIRKDLNQDYIFPQKQILNKTIADFLEENVEQKYYMNNSSVDKILKTFKITNQELQSMNKSKINILMKIPEFHQRGNVYNPNGVIGCLTATDYKTPKLIFEKHQVRKLTPKECLRIMGFPDNKIDKLLNMNISNTQLYKQAGNSIIVNVLTAILNNLN